MLETLRCPACSTRYGLRASRVHAGIRRAQCFCCDGIFEISTAVAHLLGPVAQEASATTPDLAMAALAEPDFAGADDLVFTGQEDLAAVSQEEVALAPQAEPDLAFSLEPLPVAPGEDELEHLERTLILEPVPASADLAPSLKLGDLEGAEEEAPYPTQGGNYASAKDAIAKLMGAAPSAPAAPRALGSRSSMDVEATLSALDNTLGGTQPQPAPLDHSSTVRISAQDIQAALSAAAPPPPPVQPKPAPSSPSAPPDPNLPQDPNLLKIQLEQETCNNVTTEQMAAWIEQGRVHEYHMVARQFSDHWIEASKVPALRPIFEQKKRSQMVASPEDMPIPPAEILPAKKSLFGGFFGRN